MVVKRYTFPTVVCQSGVGKSRWNMEIRVIKIPILRGVHVTGSTPNVL